MGELTRQFIERSPFVLIATAHPEGGLDVSPKGDPAGFVRIVDERTLLIPHRPGKNRIADTLTNLLADDRIALLFRISGSATSSALRPRDHHRRPRAARTLRAQGKVPKLGLLINCRGGIHALLQGDHPLRSVEPGPPHRTLAAAVETRLLRSLSDPSFDAERYDRERDDRYARGEGLY